MSVAVDAYKLTMVCKVMRLLARHEGNVHTVLIKLDLRPSELDAIFAFAKAHSEDKQDGE